MRGEGRLRWFLLVPVVAALWAVDVSAAGPDLAAARLQGAWNLTVTVAGYSGPQQASNRPVGHVATDTVWFESTCAAPGDCTVRIWGPGGPDPSQASYYQYYGTSSGFEGNNAASPLVQNGSSLGQTVQIGGFGGRLTCGLPKVQRPTQSLRLTVTDAKRSGGGWLATALTGTEVLIAGWACNGTQPLGWITQTLSITGHPVGYVAPGPAPDRTSTVTVSSIAASLNPPDKAFQSPLLLAANLVVTALVILFVTFPAALFNHTLSDNYDEISALTSRLRRFAPKVPAGPRRDAAVFGAVVLVGAWINGQLDAQFGFNGTSVVSYVATVVNICFGVAFSALVALAYRRLRRRETGWRLRALPLGLLIALCCVVISRATGFTPGYFYGLVVGVAWGTTLARHEAGHTAAIAALTTMTLAVAAWFAWAAVNPAAKAGGAGWPLVLLDDFLGSLFVGGLVGNVVALLPLRSLQGGTLINWRRPVWAVIFATAVFGLVQVLLHPEQGAVQPSGAPLLTAVLLFVAFGGGSVAFNRYFAWAGRPTRPHQPEAVPAPAHGA